MAELLSLTPAPTPRLESSDRADASRDALEACCEEASQGGQTHFLAVRTPVPPADWLALFTQAGVEQERFYWVQPSEDHAILGLGCAQVVETSGAGRIPQAARDFEALAGRLRVVGAAAPAAAGPLWLGGFAFADAPAQSEPWRDWPAGRLVLPEVLYVSRGGRAWCSVVRCIVPGARAEIEWAALQAAQAAACLAAESTLSPARSAHEDGAGDLAGAEYRVRADRGHGVYRAQVRAALAAFARGDLEKVVLARALAVEHPGRFDFDHFLTSLRMLHPTCVTFAIARGDDCFVAASPERLVALQDGVVRTGALAGTAPRGRSPEEDERIGRELRESKKEQAEHAAVAVAVRAALEDVCTPLSGPEAPRLMRIDGLQHLETPFTAHLRPEHAELSVLDLVARLHPTPAVAGLPREAALAWIAAREGLERGWYAGPVGYVDAEGGGEFRVALRSGFVRNRAPARAWLYAGAGIVPGSEPESELRETRLKLRALLAPLTEI